MNNLCVSSQILLMQFRCEIKEAHSNARWKMKSTCEIVKSVTSWQLNKFNCLNLTVYFQTIEDFRKYNTSNEKHVFYYIIILVFQETRMFNDIWLVWKMKRFKTINLFKRNIIVETWCGKLLFYDTNKYLFKSTSIFAVCDEKCARKL